MVLLVSLVLLAASASAGNTTAVAELTQSSYSTELLKQAWAGLDHPVLVAGKNPARVPILIPVLVHIQQWDALEMSFFNLKASYLASTAALPVAQRTLTIMSSSSIYHRAVSTLGVNPAFGVRMRSLHEALQHMAADVQRFCALVDQLVHLCFSPAPAHFRGSSVFCASQLVQKAAHFSMQHLVKPMAHIAKAYTVQLFTGSLSSNDISAAFLRDDSPGGPHSSPTQGSSWSRHYVAATAPLLQHLGDYLGMAGGAVDSFLESDTSILVLLLWMLALGIIVTAGFALRLQRLESAMLAMHKSGAAKHLTHTLALEKQATSILNLQHQCSRHRFSHRLLKARHTQTARQQRRAKLQLAELRKAQASAERQTIALQRRAERQEVALQTRVNHLEAALSETLSLQDRLQGVMTAGNAQVEQLQLNIAALHSQRDCAAAAQLSKQEKLEQQLAEQADVIADLRSKLDDSKLAHQLMEKRFADITPAKPADVETNSMSSIPLSEANLIKASRSWYGMGLTDGNGSVSGDQEDAPAQAAAAEAEAAAGTEGGRAALEVMPSMAISLAQHASAEVSQWYGTGPVDHNGSEVGDADDVAVEGFAAFQEDASVNPASNEQVADTIPAGRALGIKGTGIHQGAFSWGAQDFAAHSSSSFMALKKSPAQVIAETWDIQACEDGDYVSESLLGAAQESSAAVPITQQEVPVSKWGSITGSFKRRLLRLTSSRGYRKTL